MPTLDRAEMETGDSEVEWDESQGLKVKGQKSKVKIGTRERGETREQNNSRIQNSLHPTHPTPHTPHPTPFLY
ncbi:hypothetical protein [Scytonema millei]|uniref:Uncharacterized protein n=1 Tax=Scytonema millei VB511283 TaxID=1245923 RepID=A0A9X5E476_9CYAN|nr:hypothetical protein [Scytonema millei]NHC34975.1 hypothetical protein [Scytonema millei VB511283]